MKTVNMYEAKNQLSKLVADAVSGEEIIIAKNGVPLVKLEPVQEAPKRQLGLYRGLFTVPDDFDEPLPAEILRGFNG